MQRLILLVCCVLLFCLPLTLPAHEENAATQTQTGVSFVFPEQFGRDFAFVAELIEKPNTYYDQNLVDAPWLLRVTSVDGVELETPAEIEPDLVLCDDMPNYEVGLVVEWRGYECLQQVGSPRIEGEPEPQINLHYVNQLVILP